MGRKQKHWAEEHSMSAQVLQDETKGLTAQDRCDRCGAQAYARYELLAGGELMFCAHHQREHGDALSEQAVLVTDETEKLVAT